MEIGLISDVHSNAVALEAVLERLNEESVDRVLCAGDLVGYNSMPNETVELLESHSVSCVLGNHDEAVLSTTPSNFNISAKRAADWTRREMSPSSRRFLSELPHSLRLNLGGLDIYMTHGSPIQPLSEYVFKDDVSADRIDRWFNESPDVIVLGHTHKPFAKEVKGTIVINPGSVGQPRDGNPRTSFALLNTQEKSVELHRIEYNVSKIVNETKKYLPRKLAERLYEGV